MNDLTSTSTKTLNKLIGRIIDYKYKLMVQGVDLIDRKIYITPEESNQIRNQDQILGYSVFVTEDENLLNW